MKSWLRALSVLLCLCMLFPALLCRAEDTMAQDISSVDLVSDCGGIHSRYFLFDGDETWGSNVRQGAYITLTYEAGIGSLYFLFGTTHGLYTVTDNDTGTVYTCGENGFLHDYLDLEAMFGHAPGSVTVTMAEDSFLYELYVYSPGEVPDTVQKWELAPEDGVDLMLFSTHGDDEQLFFAGVLPYYAGELGYEVLVVYLTDHHNFRDGYRMQEMLNGLWAVGVTNYPVFGTCVDYLSDSKRDTYDNMRYDGMTREDILGFIVEQIRRYNPLVAVAHDFNGEYGHFQHIIYAELVAEALEITADGAYYPESADNWGLWDVPKAYFHLYEENAIVMDWDQPLEHFDGLTAFQVTQTLGFPCHKTQQETWFYRWINGWGEGITKASQITTYSPCNYGLYRSTVGADAEKNDFFENLSSYEEQARIAEEQRLAEEARLAEELRLEQEASRAAEESSLAAETTVQTETTETASGEPEPAQRSSKSGNIALIAIGLCASAAVIVVGKKRRKK